MSVRVFWTNINLIIFCIKYDPGRRKAISLGQQVLLKKYDLQNRVLCAAAPYSLFFWINEGGGR